MEGQCDECGSPDIRNMKTEPIDVNTKEMVDLVEIDPESNIKLEPDEIETIEYTVTSIQMAGIFVPKVEKVEPSDSHDDQDGTGFLSDRNFTMNQQSGRIERSEDGRKMSSTTKLKTTVAKTIGKVKSTSKSKANRRQYKCLECDYITTGSGNWK